MSGLTSVDRYKEPLVATIKDPCRWTYNRWYLPMAVEISGRLIARIQGFRSAGFIRLILKYGVPVTAGKEAERTGLCNVYCVTSPIRPLALMTYYLPAFNIHRCAIIPYRFGLTFVEIPIIRNKSLITSAINRGYIVEIFPSKIRDSSKPIRSKKDETCHIFSRINFTPCAK